MERKQFIKGFLGTTILLSMDGISTLANAFTLQNAKRAIKSDEIAFFDAVYLNYT
jgi:hypothetical protein